MKPIFWMTSLVMVTSIATAQRYGINSNYTGSGTLNRSGDRNSIDRAEVSLSDGGSATVTLIGSKRWTYQGRWRNHGKDDYMVDITLAYGDRNARGSIQISVKDGDVDEIIVRDGYADNTRFSANFRVRGGGYDDDRNPPYGGSIVGSGTTRGSGNYTAPNQRGKTITSVSHTFNSNGTFTIRPSGGESFSGRYTRSGNTLRLQITQIGNQRTSSGSGTASMSDRNLNSVNMNARNNRGNYSLNWRSSYGNRPGDPGNDYGRPFKFDDRGTGRATALSGHDLEVDRATGDFRGDGRFIIWLFDGGRRVSVEGRWNDGYFFSNRGDDRYPNRGQQGDDRFWNGARIVLDMDKYDGRTATGTGTYDRNGSNNSPIGQLTIAGTSGRQKIAVGFHRGRR